MSTIKRYQLYCLTGSSKPETQADYDGSWVRYTDHLAAVEAAVMAERAECEAACEKLSVDHRAVYKGRVLPRTPEAFNPHTDGKSDGAFECAEAIRARTKPAKEGE